MGHVRTVSEATFATACIAATIGLIFSVGFIIFNVTQRQKRIVKMSSPRLNVMINCGGFILNACCLLYGFDYFLDEQYSAATVTCQMRTWLTSLGFTIVFAPMFAKAWRVYQIFRNAGIKKVVIRDTKLFLMTAVFLLVDGFMMALWHGIDPMTSRPVPITIESEPLAIPNITVYVSYITVQECSSKSSEVWISLVLIWKISFLIYGLYLSWKTRNVIIPSLKDAASMVISILLTLVVMSSAIMFTCVFRHTPDAVYIVHVLLITVCVTTVQILLFWPKVHVWWQNPEDKPVRVSSTPYVKTPAGHEIDFLVTENMSLKKSLSAKDKLIKELDSHLNNAKEKLSEITIENDVRLTRLDSGIGVEISHEDIDSGNDRTICQKSDTNSVCSEKHYTRKKRSITPQHELRLHRTNSDCSSARRYKRKLKETKIRRTNSTSSMNSCKDVNQIHDSIATDLAQAHILSTSIQKSISRDLSFNKKQNSLYYDSLRSRQDIAGSLAQCYDLHDSSETLSYVSSYLSEGGHRRKLEFDYKDSESLRISCDTLSIGNDKLYPEDLKSPTLNSLEYNPESCIFECPGSEKLGRKFQLVQSTFSDKNQNNNHCYV